MSSPSRPPAPSGRPPPAAGPPAPPRRAPPLAPAAFGGCLAAALAAALAARAPLPPAASLGAALALALAASALVARALGRLAERQIAPLRQSARTLLGGLGPGEGPASEAPPPEAVDDLARSLERLGGGLSATLARLADERDRLESILETMMEGVLVTDGAGRIVLANGALRELTPMSPSPIGRRPIEAIRNGELAELLQRVLLEGRPEGAEIELGGLEVRKVRVRAAPLRRPAAQGVVAVLYDVTDLRRLEGMRRDFVANVSHELRTPIAAIRAAAETLEDGALADPQASGEFVGIIGRNAARLYALVEDLLELSRLDARRLDLVVRPLGVAEAFDSAVSLHAHAAEKKGIALGSAGGDPSLAVEADARALERILSNLVDNAIKYSRPGDAVTLSAERRGGSVRLAVADTGPGIEARHLPRLFERFYRADKGRSRAEGGTGLGLAIVKNLAEALGGRLSVESEVGKGSRFYVDLAAAARAPERGEGTPADLPPAENRSTRAAPWESTTDATR
ncbi:MAG TPA: ATP-binding protein [Polyangiaceae bacterium]|nr:ATP-binding protein [Polyangiaceae bacterium]